MKIRIPLLLSIILLLSCQKVELQKNLEKAEGFYPMNPDSANIVLHESIDAKDLSGNDLVKWCYLSSLVADTLNQKLPSDTLLVKASRHVRKAEKSDMAVYIYYYTGRALADNKDYKEALEFYLDALKIAEEQRMFNLAGYICSYMGDLYLAEYDGTQALAFYSRAESFFENAGNKRSQAIALRDIAKSYSYGKDFNKALLYAFKADSIVQKFNEPLLKGSIAGYLGRFYSKLGDYKKAEFYIRKSIDMAPQYAYQSQLALVDIMMAQRRLIEGKNLIDSLSSCVLVPKQKMVLYKYRYEVEKYLHNMDSALVYLEKENLIADSIRSTNQAKTLYEIEQKYEKEQLINANNKLKIQYQEVVIVVIGLVLLLLLIFVFFRSKEHRRKQSELKLKQELVEKEKEAEINKAQLREQELISKNNEILIKAREQELNDARKRFGMMKDVLFQRSILFEKIKVISGLPIKSDLKKKSYDSAVKDIFGDPALSEGDWENLKQITNELYPGFTDRLAERVPALSNEEINFCCLLRFDLSSDKLALLLNITPNTIKSKRYRIMQKAGVTNQNIRLEDFLDSIS